MKKQIIGFLILLISVSIGIFIVLQQPQYDGFIYTDNSNPELQSIQIHRESIGFPHIKAKNKKAVFYGLGYAHAQDRLWQMAFRRMLGQGRLSEFLGIDFIKIDKFFRNIGIHRISKVNTENLPKDLFEIFEYYSNGVNDYVKSLRVLPIEFILTGVSWEQWTPVDSMIIVKMVNFFMNFDWKVELTRQEMTEAFGFEKTNEVLPLIEKYFFDQTTVVSDEELKLFGFYEESHENRSGTTSEKYQGGEYSSQIDPKVEQTQQEVPPLNSNIKAEAIQNIYQLLDLAGKGSNVWAVHGNHTKSGKPLLANDPHVDNEAPNFWYQVELMYPNESGDIQQISGISLSGMPTLVAGKANYVAWGLTVNIGDFGDIYVETLDKTGKKYYYDGQYYDIQIIQEEIKIKDYQKPEILNVKFTKNGPIFEHQFDPNFPNLITTERVISLAWLGYLKEEKIFQCLLEMMLAKNMDDVKKSLLLSDSSFYNIVFATEDGHIGYTAIGKSIQKNHVDSSIFKDGTKKEHDWAHLGFVPDHEKLFILDPPKGYIVSANNRISSYKNKGKHGFLGIPSARAMRITQMIEQKIQKEGYKMTQEDMKEIQLDILDSYAQIVVPNMVIGLKEAIKDSQIIPNGDERSIIQNMLDVLEKWDFQTGADSEGALLFNVWEVSFYKRFFQKGNYFHTEELLRRAYSNEFWLQFSFKKLKEIFDKNYKSYDKYDQWWCKSPYVPTNKAKEYSCVYQILQAFLDAHYYIKENNIQSWGQLHPHLYNHIPFGEVPILNRIFNRQKPASGNIRTVNCAITLWRNRKFNSYHSGTYRVVFSLDKNEASFVSQDMGVSGNIFSKFYDNLLDSHNNGEYYPLNTGEDKFNQYKYKLTLNPKQ